MRNIRYLFSATLVALALLSSCEVSEVNSGAAADSAGPYFEASFEETRVFLDGQMHTCWNAGDLISVFTTTTNERYRFEGATGDRSGFFSKTEGDAAPSGSAISANYAVYPYNSLNSMSKQEILSLELPAVQDFAPGSFAPGSNVMVAKTNGPSDNSFVFRNLCGVLVVRLYGDGLVKSLLLEGNNGEKIAGKAIVSTYSDSVPFALFDDDASGSITLDCGEGVTLGKNASDATSFWFVIPPTVFAEGFTVRVQGQDSKQAVLTTRSKCEILRNTISAMEPAEAVFNVPAGNVVFEDASFKSYCTKQFDRDDDGEISYVEAFTVDTIKVSRKSISSLKGIEGFVNLRYLDCSQNRLTALDVGKCPLLRTLLCNGNLISSLTLSGNPKLEVLHCGSNQLSTLSLFRNTNLREVSCDINQLTRLDVVTCALLEKLECRYNKLVTLNLGGNPALKSLKCNRNELTGLTLVNNAALTDLDCSDNKLPALQLLMATALENLNCNNNQLTNLDVSRCAALRRLEVKDNKLNLLVFGNNPKLSTVYCSGNLLSTLDVSGLKGLMILACQDNPALTDIWLADGQNISNFTHDEGVRISYK